MSKTRTVYFLSDRTGITAETLGHSLLTQFEGFDFKEVLVPFIGSKEIAESTRLRINHTAETEGQRPIVFSTVVDEAARSILQQANGQFFDFFAAFIGPLEQELETASANISGLSHNPPDASDYKMRIDAVNYALANDDGMNTRHYEQADVLLIGVSRSGKTPTCLYLALHYGVYAANYPITEEDLHSHELPEPLRAHRDKLYGLTIQTDRLAQIRAERRPDSRYASLKQCEMEVSQVERLFKTEGIPFLNTTTTSIEEIATRIVYDRKLKQHFY